MPKGDGLEEVLADYNGPVEILHFYNGEVELRYSDELHTYFIEENGKKFLVPNVSTVCGMIDKSGPLTQWAANMTTDYIRENLEKTYHGEWTNILQLVRAEQGAYLIDPVKFNVLLEEARFNFRTVSKQATDIGKIAHKWLENYIKARIVRRPYEAALPSDEKARNAVNAALNWMERHKFDPLFSERKIYSREYNYSGTFDWIAKVTGCGNHECCPFDGEVLALGDFKSSRSLYDEYRCQLAAYRYAWEEEFPDMPIGVCILLRLGKDDGSFDSLTITQEEFDTDFDGYLGTLQMYAWARQLYLNKRYDKAVAKAMKKAAKSGEKKKRKAPRRVEIREHEPIPVAV